MVDSVLFLGWKKPFEGRQKDSLELFNVYVNYLNEQVKVGAIESYEPVILMPHGGDLNGYILIRGEVGKLDVFRHQNQFIDLSMRASVLLDGYGLIEGFVGPSVQRRMDLYRKNI